MNRILLGLLLSGLVAMLGCDGDEGMTGGADCRRAVDACAPGYRCLPIGGGAFDCVPGRDAMVQPMDMLVQEMPDMEMEEDMNPAESDGTLSSDSGPMMTSDSGPMTTTDSGAMMTSDSGMEDPDAGETPDALVDEDAEVGEPDAAVELMPDAAPVVDADGPAPIEDQGVPILPDAAVVDPVDMGGDQFGPGRCNHDGMWPREDRDLGGQDQNGARQINPGIYQGLTVGGVDFSDWYRVEVCEGGTLSITVEHEFGGVDLDVDVWHPREARLGQSQGQCTGREFFEWRNQGEIVDIRFNVYPWAPPGRNGNNRYDLTIRVACP